MWLHFIDKILIKPYFHPMISILLKSLLLLSVVLTLSAGMHAQTMGLFMQSEAAQNGYTLIAPSSSEEVYLIDNCGKEIHQWVTNSTPGLSTYLLENGDLLRTGRIPSSFGGGGTGGRIERISWNSDLLWGYTFSTEDYHQHHDVELLPNGNILVIAWELVDRQIIMDAGRSSVGASGFWGCLITEIEPIGTDDANIVWEWRAIDHLVQDADSSLANFGVISDFPERIDVNLDPGQSTDWLHVNGIDYHEEFDQIVLSVHDVHEVWVIDHSTTTAEAAGSTGGRYGKGGDLLYRYGNPQNYGRGDVDDQVLFGQHDAQWIDPGLPGAGSMMVFNNGLDRSTGPNFSTVDVWQPAVDSVGNYILEQNQPYLPTTPDWSVGDSGLVSFYSSRISGAQRLQNGNTLICVGRDGELIEVDEMGELVWNYINPVGNIRYEQGQNPSRNDMFRAYRYARSYGAFQGRMLTPGEPLEINPLPYNCDIFSSTDLVQQPTTVFNLYPNPAMDRITIDYFSNSVGIFQIFSATGQSMLDGVLERNATIELSDFESGLYLCVVIDERTGKKQGLQFIVSK